VHEDEAQQEMTFVQKDPYVGTTLSGRYVIDCLLGRGGMSSVYRARHLVLQNKVVAIKLLHEHLCREQSSLLRFKQEARAASALAHPNIIGIEDFGLTDEGTPYQVIDLLQGVSLADAIKQAGRLTVARALHIFVQACDALAHAHERGVIHRDLKPSNIMLVAHGGDPNFVKIVDFGIAKVLPEEGYESQGLTKTGDILGSPLYMSPEQCMGTKLDSRSDIYSMGCVMYETLVGTPPFKGVTIYETIYKHTSEMPADIVSVVPDLPLVRELNAVILKAMAKDPAQRYQSIAQMRDELIGLARGARGTWLERGRKALEVARIKLALKQKRFPVKLVASLGAAVLLLAAVSASMTYNFFAGKTVPTFRETAWPKYVTHFEDDPGAFRNEHLRAVAFINMLSRERASNAKMARAYYLAGSSCVKYGRWDSAAIYFDKLRPLLHTLTFERRLPEEAELYSKMADTYYNLDRYPAAEEFYGRAAALWDRLAEANAEVYGRARAKLADILQHEHKFSQAQQLYAAAGSSQREAAAGTGYDQALFYSKWGDLMRARGDWKQAAELYKVATTLWLTQPEKQKKNAAIVLYYSALVAEQQGEVSAAEKYYREAIRLLEKHGGSDEPNFAAILEQFSNLLFRQNKWFEAVSVRARAREVWAQTQHRQD
jgi:tetratricopeptide (TPR) repeat protein/tRNA A-37 threonylcarbamoyl transferase component Bud32